MHVEPFSLALARPLATARGAITEREGFVVRLSVDGTTGVGEATPLPGWTESRSECEAALEQVADVLSADDTGEPTALLDDRGTLADAPAARHAVASAALDARARATSEPLYRVLVDGSTRTVESVPANATVGDGTPDETADAAAAAVTDGFETVKVKVGARGVADDDARLAAVRERCPDVTLRADANGAWDSKTAERALASFADHDVAYVEQPLAADATVDEQGRRDLRAHASLRDAGADVGIALDESLAVGDDPVAAALAADAADALILKPMALGGPDRAAAAAREVRAAGVTPVVTTTVDGALARAGAVHAAATIPDVPACGLATADRLAADLIERDPAPVSAGRVRVPDGAGAVGTTSWHQPMNGRRD
ncbi:MAG: enolase C-terminal domain-like protein [Haloglomus sp.]